MGQEKTQPEPRYIVKDHALTGIRYDEAQSQFIRQQVITMNEVSSGLFKVNVSFRSSDGHPLGQAYTVTVRDEDPLFDGTLGEAALDAEGRASIMISVADISSVDSPAERKPDLYFVLEKDGEEVFRSDVIDDVDFEKFDETTGELDDLTRTFGPYTVDT